jgi:hypothetical protein
MPAFQIFLFPLGVVVIPPPPVGDFILLEDGFFLLQENGFRFLLE